MAPQTAKVRRRAVAAAVTDLERVAAAATPQQPGQETPTAARRLARARLHVGVGFDHRQMAEIARPIKVTRMMVRNHDLPLIDRHIVPRGPADPAVDNRRAALALAVHVRAREEGIRDDGVHARVIRGRPFGDSVRACRHGSRGPRRARGGATAALVVCCRVRRISAARVESPAARARPDRARWRPSAHTPGPRASASTARRAGPCARWASSARCRSVAISKSLMMPLSPSSKRSLTSRGS